MRTGVSGGHILYTVVSLSTFILYNLGSSNTKKAGMLKERMLSNFLTGLINVS